MPLQVNHKPSHQLSSSQPEAIINGPQFIRSSHEASQRSGIRKCQALVNASQLRQCQAFVNASQRSGIRQCQAFVNASQRSGILQCQAFVNASQRSGIRQCQAFVNASQRSGILQRQAFFNARHSSTPVRDTPTSWSNMLHCAMCSRLHVSIVHCICARVHNCIASVVFASCSFAVCRSLLCASVTTSMSSTWDALLTPVLVRHPGNASELGSKRLRGQQYPQMCTYAHCDYYHRQIPSTN